MTYLVQLILGARISRFALIGAFGTVLNILIMMALTAVGIDYISAAIIAGETTIITNFLLQEKLAFGDLGNRRRPFLHRFLHAFTFNTLEAMARVPLLWALVEYVHLPSLVAQVGTLCASFFIRYAYHLKIIYAQQDNFPPVPGDRPSVLLPEPGPDRE
ncbi:GtrA family protein [Pseudarthrobacter sp. WHRI 8279]|uniref:GtrA family protein n=1 Tax=Pseudarthrobacter sp. WHRI 8279 TaxID=3162566 RepID=UPI0032ED279E